MVITRYILMAVSAFMAIVMLFFWTVTGKATDLVLFIVLPFFARERVLYFLYSTNAKDKRNHQEGIHWISPRLD